MSDVDNRFENLNGDERRALPVKVLGGVAAPSATFNRPADTVPYSVGDLVANSTVTGAVVAMQFAAARTFGSAFSIVRGRLRKSGTGVANAAFRVLLFTALPVVSAGDNVALLCNQSQGFLGSLDFSSMRAFSDGAAGIGIPADGALISGNLGLGTVIYGLIEARGEYPPLNGETFEVTLEVSRD